MMVRWSGEVQVNVKSQFELDIGGCETCSLLLHTWDKAICMGLSNQNFIITESYNTIRVCLYNFSRVQFNDYSKDFVLFYLVVYL